MARQSASQRSEAKPDKAVLPSHNLSVAVTKRDNEGKPQRDGNGNVVTKLFRCGALWPRKNGSHGYTGIFTNTIAGEDERVVVLPNESDSENAPQWDFFVEHVDSEDRKELIKVGSMWDHETEGFSGRVKIPFSTGDLRVVALPPREREDG